MVKLQWRQGMLVVGLVFASANLALAGEHRQQYCDHTVQWKCSKPCVDGHGGLTIGALPSLEVIIRGRSPLTRSGSKGASRPMSKLMSVALKM